MFKVIEDSAPQLIGISNSIRDEILLMLIVAIFFGRLVFLQCTFGGPEKYKSLMVDLVGGYALMFLLPPMVTYFAGIPESIFGSLAESALYIDLEKAPEVIDSDISWTSSLKEISLNILHWSWIIVFYIVYYVWLLFYSAAIALCSCFVFVGTFLGRRNVLSLYFSMLTVLIFFPLIWAVFDKVIYLFLPNEEFIRGIGIIFIYILKVYVMWKSFLGLSQSKAAGVIKEFGRETSKPLAMMGSHIAWSNIGQSTAELSRNAMALAGHGLNSSANKLFSKIKDQRTTTRVQSSESLESSSKSENGHKLTVPFKRVASFAENLNQKAYDIRKAKLKERALEFANNDLSKVGNPVKYYNLNTNGEIPANKISKSVFENAYNLTGYKNHWDIEKFTYNPEGNLIYDKSGIQGKPDIRKSVYLSQAREFNEHLSNSFINEGE